MTTNFETILGRGFNELPKPTPVPDGKYLLKARFASAFEWTSKEGDEGARIQITSNAVKPIEVDGDVSDDDYKGKSVETSFYVTNTEEELKVWDELAKRGIPQEGKLEDALKLVKGTTVIGSVRTRNFTDKNDNAAFRNMTVKTEAVSL
jgi:hypothetical protein